MEKENHQSNFDAVMETLTDSGGTCDLRKILSNENNSVFDGNMITEKTLSYFTIILDT